MAAAAKAATEPLHVGGAPAIEQAILDLGGKGFMFPIGLVAHGYYIGVAGKTQMRFRRSDAGKEIFNVWCFLILENQALADEAMAAQQIFKHSQRSALMGSDGTTADEILENDDGVG